MAYGDTCMQILSNKVYFEVNSAPNSKLTNFIWRCISTGKNNILKIQYQWIVNEKN